MPQFLGNTITNHTAAMAAYRQPCFAIWSNNSSQGGFSVYDHNMYCSGRFQHHNSSPGGGAGMNSTGAPELFDTFYSNNGFQTNGTPGSSNSFYGHGTASVSYLGNLSFTIGEGFAGEMMGTSSSPSYRGQSFRDVGTIVNEPRQDYAIWLNSTAFRIGPRSANWYSSVNSGIGSSHHTMTLSNKAGTHNSTKYGMLSYNAKTNKLCVIEQNGSYSSKPIIYNDVPRLSLYAENIYQGMSDQSAARNATTGSDLYTFFNTAANYSTSYSTSTGKPSNQTAEDNQRGITVMCDDGKIVMFQMIPSYGAWVHRWNADGTAAGSVINMNWTTSYGIDQGTAYGARFQISSDGRYVMAYCASYYYNSGYQAAIIRVADGKVVYDFNNDSTYGYQCVPIGKSDFFMARDVNGDSGAGLYAQYIHVNHLMHTVADGGRANFGRSNLTQLFSNNFHSTDYPIIIPIKYDTKLFYDL